MFVELAGKDYDRFRTVADLAEMGRLAATEGERKTHTSPRCDCDAFTNNVTAKCAFSSSRSTATASGVHVENLGIRGLSY